MTDPGFHPAEIIQLGNLRFQAKTIVEGLMLGGHSSPYHGFSVGVFSASSVYAGR
ncbi:MAG: hypothetical protein U5N56_12270 [Candidatus Marinimicrobia bacterium]|nr:hypothetical protein [Candidatus Neomarinimicrobiota bacterium]